MPNRIVIYKGELEYMSRCILDYPNIETGGNLFGFYTPFGIPVIQYILGPGKKSAHDPTHFKQDATFFNSNTDLLIEEHALHHIGTWHSHHELSINYPSSGDVSSMFDGMKADGLKKFLLVIGNCFGGETTVKAYFFSADKPNYQHCQWVILNGDSPIRLQFDKKHQSIISVPHTLTSNARHIQSVPLIGNRVMTRIVSYPKEYWLHDKTNNIELKKIVDYLKITYENVSFRQLEKDHTLQVIVKDIHSFNIIFPIEFPKVPPVICSNEYIYDNSGWENTGAISQRVINYMKNNEL